MGDEKILRGCSGIAVMVALTLAANAQESAPSAAPSALSPDAIYAELGRGRWSPPDVEAFLLALEADGRHFARDWWTEAADAAARAPKADPALQQVVARAKKRSRDVAKEDAEVRLIWSHLGGHLRALIEKKAPNEASAALGGLELLTANFGTEARRTELVDLRGRIERLRGTLKTAKLMAEKKQIGSSDQLPDGDKSLKEADRAKTKAILDRVRSAIGDRPEVALGEFLKYGHPSAYDTIDTMLRVRENAEKGRSDIYRLRAHARSLGAERSVVVRLAGKTDVTLIAEAGRETPLTDGPKASVRLESGVAFEFKALPGEYVGFKFDVPALKTRLIGRDGTKSDFIEVLSLAEVDGKAATSAQWQATGSRTIERARLEFEEFYVSDVKPGTPPKKNEFGFMAMDYHVPNEAPDDYLVVVKVTLKEALDVLMGRSDIFKDTIRPLHVPFEDGHKTIETSFGAKRAAARWMMTTSIAPTLVFIVPRRTR